MTKPRKRPRDPAQLASTDGQYAHCTAEEILVYHRSES